MVWPFKRRPTPPAEPITLPPTRRIGDPTVYHEAVTAILKKARLESANVQDGAEFTVELKKSLLKGVTDIDKLGLVLLSRARDDKLALRRIAVVDSGERWRFTFMKLPSSMAIPLEDTNVEDIVTEFLQSARQYATELPVGASFSLTLPEDKRRYLDSPVELVGPIMFRCGNYGLEPGTCFNWEFEFTKSAP